MLEVSTLHAVQEPIAEHGTVPGIEMVASEVAADSQMAELAEAVDSIYTGYEQELREKVVIKIFGKGDGLGFEKEIH